ncbi:hypothetical protein C6P42_003888 [Pichia californica]|nr:hypothetical protein C6P42_003888 [[Candida] californica]
MPGLHPWIKVITTSEETIYGTVHSYCPHSLITLIETPRNSSTSTSTSTSASASSSALALSSSLNPNYSTNSTFIAINVQFVKSIHALEKDKPQSREKININDRFSNKIDAPTFIPTNTLGKTIIKGSKEITKQEIEFKLRRMIKNKKIPDEGKKVLRTLGSIFPIDSITIDESNNIKFLDSDIKIFKPYKSTDVKVIGGDGGIDEQHKLTYIKKTVDKAWEKIEQNKKGG